MPKARRRPSKPPSLLPTGLMPTAHTLARGDYEVTRVELNGPKVARNREVLPMDRELRAKRWTQRQMTAAESILTAHILVFGAGGTKDPLDQRIRGAYAHETEAAVDRVRRARELLDRVQRRMGSYRFHLVERVSVRNEDPRPWPRDRYAELLEGLDIAADALGLAVE